MLPAVLAAEVAVSTKLVTAALRRYQITNRRIARLGLARLGPVGEKSGSFGDNGVNDALEQVASAPSRKDQLGIGRVVFQFGAKP